MFIGEFAHSIDEKGRVAVPFRFRRDLGKGAIIAKSIEQSLTIYPKQEWQNMAEKLANLPMFDPKAKALSRFIFSSAVEVEFDSQGRALIPHNLRDYAQLNKSTIVIGVYNKIEIWDNQKWVEEQKKSGIGTLKFEQDIQRLGI